MADNKTKATGLDVDTFLSASARPDDARVLKAMMEKLSGEPAAMWGPSIVGFGRCRYRYDSGREGEMPLVAFSPRKPNLVLYLADDFAERDALLGRLGPHSVGKSCLYLKRLDGVDLGVLEQLIMASLEHTRSKYPDG